MSADNPFIKHLTKIIEPSLLRPNWPHLPSFPYDKFSHLLAEKLGLSPFHVEFVKADWQSHAKTAKTFGKHPAHFSFHLAPITDPFFMIMSLDDKSKLGEWCLGTPVKNNSLINAYLEFTLSKVLRAIDELGIYSGLKPSLSHDSYLEEEAYVIYLTIHHGEQQIPVCLVCPTSFHHQFIKHYQSKPFSITAFNSIENMLITTPLELGSVELSHQEWGSVKVGDWIVLDQCSYHPLEKKGTLTMVLNQTPLFQLKIKEGQIKVLDYIFYQQGLSMNPQNPNTDEDSYEEEFTSGENQQAPSLTMADEIPLSLRVEIGQLNMSLKELVQIKPGSIIPLSTHPEREVKLTLNGRCIALGELLELDDAVGIKITELP